MSCDLSRGSVDIVGTNVTCNGGVSFPIDKQLKLTGTTVNYSVKVTNADVSLILSNLSITHGSPFAVDQSSVRILLNQSAALMASSTGHAGIECSGFSNISLESVFAGYLTATGGSLSAGLGTGAIGSCNSLRIQNGSYSISGGSGIGSGSGNSVVNLIEIISGIVSADSSSHGAGIGSGYSGNGTSSVGSIRILGGEISATSSSYSAGIGSGHADSGNSSVSSIFIHSSDVTASVSRYGVGIGAGPASSGTSSVASVIIAGSNVQSSGHYGSGLGSGLGEDSSGISSVSTIAIENSTVNAVCHVKGAAIGSGPGSPGSSTVDLLTITSSSVSASGDPISPLAITGIGSGPVVG
jgi:hypothetical protein